MFTKNNRNAKPKTPDQPVPLPQPPPFFCTGVELAILPGGELTMNLNYMDNPPAVILCRLTMTRQLAIEFHALLERSLFPNGKPN
jgi:hypothetical protein